MRLVAYVTATEIRVLRCSAGALCDEARFTADDAGLAAWRAYLGGRRRARLTVVIDVPGEEFHDEAIPRLRGRDRRAVLERRLAQRYPNARLTAALPLGDAAGDRSREGVLLVSLAGAQRIEPWLDAVHEAGVVLAAVTSTALLAPSLLEHLDIVADRALLISVQRAGLRECFLQAGRLRFARLEAGWPGDAEAGAPRLRAEVDRLLAYLASVRALPQPGTDALPLVLIAGRAQRAYLERALAGAPGIALHLLPLEDGAERLGIERAPADLGAEQLSLALAAKHPPREGFARPAERAAAWRRQVKQVWLAAGAAGLLAGAIAAGAQWLEARDLREEARRIRTEARLAVERHPAGAVPDAYTRSENLRLVVDEMQRLAARSAPPESALVHVSRALERTPQIALDALTWSVQPEAGGAATSDAGRATQSVEISARLVGDAAAGTRAQSAEIARFAAALQSASGWQVVRTRLPFDLSPQGTLRGGEGAKHPEPSFTVVIARSLP